MNAHITNEDLALLLENFINENPYADTFEIARFMYEKGHEAGMTETCELF